MVMDFGLGEPFVHVVNPIAYCFFIPGLAPYLDLVTPETEPPVLLQTQPACSSKALGSSLLLMGQHSRAS